MDYDILTEKEVIDSVSLRKLLHKRVVTKKGKIIGKVKDIKVIPEKLVIEGIMVSRGFLRKKIFIGSSYIKNLSEESLILDIEPAVLLLGKKVITTDGEFVGKIKKINRKAQTNDIESLIVGSLFRKNKELKASSINRIADSVIINA